MNPMDKRQAAAAAAHGMAWGNYNTIQPDSQPFETLKVNSKTPRLDYDPATFTSFNSPLPIYPRATGFIDFKSQMKRPDLPLN